jgi:hypothetical protein
VVPPLIVKNPSISTPDAVSVGAVPPAKVTPEKYVTVAEPPLVRIIINDATSPLDATLDTVNVVVPDMVLVK